MTFPKITNKKLKHELTSINQWLRNRSRILVVTHRRPDGDAIGSACALAEALHINGIRSSVYFMNPLPEAYQTFLNHEITLYGDINLTEFDHVVTLDCGNDDRLALPNDMTFDELKLPSANIDHHISNDEFADINLVDSKAAATAHVLAKLFSEFDWKISSDVASLLLIGLLTDCGCFRFNNTKSDVLRTGAWLMDQGGDYDQVIDKIYSSEPIEKMRLQAKVIENIRFYFKGRVATFFVTKELLDSCGATSLHAENLVDIVRTIKGVEIVCRMQKIDEGVRFSLRSTNSKRPILKIAKEIGGGGHNLAAGATMDTFDFDQAEKTFLSKVKEFFNE